MMLPFLIVCFLKQNVNEKHDNYGYKINFVSLFITFTHY